MTMNPISRIDLATFDVGGGFRVEVYRRNDRFGTGGCMSFCFDDVEIMRFDLFAPMHMHFAVTQGDAPRILYPPGTIQQHMDRSLWDVEHNSDPAILMCSSPKVAGKRPDWNLFAVRMPEIRAALEKATG